MDAAVRRLIDAARSVRESEDGSDDAWTQAHEELYTALAAFEAPVAAGPEAPAATRRRPHWTTELGITTARSTAGAQVATAADPYQ